MLVQGTYASRMPNLPAFNWRISSRRWQKTYERTIQRWFNTGTNPKTPHKRSHGKRIQTLSSDALRWFARFRTTWTRRQLCSWKVVTPGLMASICTSPMALVLRSRCNGDRLVGRLGHHLATRWDLNLVGGSFP